MSSEGIPDEKACLEILRKAGCSQEVIAHTLFVKEVALKIAARCKQNVRIDLVVAGALLHDIGRAVTHGVAHGVRGGEIARNLGVDERIVRIIERHVGGGITREEAAKLGLGNRPLSPETIEEKIVCIADKLVAHDRIAGVEAEVRKLEEKGLHTAAERVRALYNEVVDICGGLDL
ncbi:MAG: HDIG domain-containing protein [Thermoplasmata archaeon]|nr:HDIG domain-containing protein [Thermoplasmata archaeon]